MADNATTLIDARVQWPSWLDIVAGVWLIIAPFALGYDGETAPLWNDIIVGIIIAGLALIAGVTLMTWPSWLNVLAGIWLIIAPFALGYESDTAVANDVIVGIIVIVLAGLAIYLKRQPAEPY